MLYLDLDKRRYVRIPGRIGVNIVKYNRKKTGPKLDEEIGLNISIGGILIECSKKLSVKSILKLKIMFPFESKYTIISGAALVMWNKKSFRKTYYIGCKFDRLKEKDKFVLIQYIKNILL